MKVIPLLCGHDNYCYLLQAPNGETALFDASDEVEILHQLEALGLRPNLLFLTHHHADHIAGVAGLAEAFGEMKIHQPEFAPVHEDAFILKGGESIPFGGTNIQVLATPYHTMTSLSYLVERNLFTGDSLFVAGCGRMFEGDCQNLYETMNLFLGLDEETRIHTGHDYGTTNLRFALSVEPGNQMAQAKLENLNGAEGAITSLKEEKRYNPFLRFAHPDLIAAFDPECRLTDLKRLCMLREKRNHFR